MALENYQSTHKNQQTHCALGKVVVILVGNLS